MADQRVPFRGVGAGGRSLNVERVSDVALCDDPDPLREEAPGVLDVDAERDRAAAHGRDQHGGGHGAPFGRRQRGEEPLLDEGRRGVGGEEGGDGLGSAGHLSKLRSRSIRRSVSTGASPGSIS